MRFRSLLPATLAAVAAISTSAQTPIVATTGEPELVETSISGSTFVLTEAEYQKEAQRLATDARFIAMRKKPAGLSDKARFGVGFVLEETNRSWAIDRDTAGGYTFYGDVKGNGDLGDDAPRKFVDEQGKPTLRISMQGRAESGETHPILIKLQLDMIKPPDTPEKALALVRYSTTRRRGQVTLDPSAPPLTFRMTGPQGLFNLSYGSISFDFDGDGAYDTEIERYGNKERFVNVGGATYEFAADKYGNRVTFTRLAEKRPARIILKTGYPAPDFAFVDLAGRTRKLSDFRGTVVLIDFWGTWCGPCVAGMPELVRLYTEYHPRGFEILGIEAKDTRETVAAFIAAHHMPWPQTLEHDTDPIARLYRIDGWPTAFLVGADGTFLSASYLGEVKLAEELAKAFPER
jgi:thiol-disulfide isomerase/thioredoxin